MVAGLFLWVDEMKKITFYILLSMLVMFCGFVSGAVAEEQFAYVSAVEPVENTDGSALDDLAGLNLYYYLSTDGPGTVVVLSFPATKPTGGGAFAEDISILIPAGETQTYMFYLTAVTLDGLESEPSSVGSKTFISALSKPLPGAPTNFMVDGGLLSVLSGDVPATQ